MTETLVVIGVLSIAIPLTVYYTIKLGRFAWFRGKHLADRYNEREDQSNG